MTPNELAFLHRLCFSTPRPWTAAEFTELLRSPGVFLIKKSKGFALGRIAGPEMELLTLAVHPDARRRGIGTALLEELVGYAKEKGVEQAFLEVSEQNRSAVALYRACGYKDAGYRKDYYASPNGPKASALVMLHDLTCA